MADGGLRKVIRYSLNLVRCDNGSASNAISAQISKTLAVIVKKTYKNDFTNESESIST